MSTTRDKVPFNLEVEALLIGALLNSPRCIVDVADKIEPHHFYAPEYQEVYTSIRDRFQNGKPINAALVAGECGELFSDGPDHLYIIADSSLGPLNAPDYAQTVRDLWQRRELIGISIDLNDKARDLSDKQTADEIAGVAAAALQGTVEAEAAFESAGEVFDRVVSDLGKEPDITPTGLECYDEAIGGGLHGGRFYGIGGRFKSGKSFFLSSISYNMRHVPHVYLTLESSGDEILKRIIARHSGFNARAFNDDRERVAVAAERAREDIRQSALVFRRRPRMSLEQLKATLAQIGLSGKYKGVIVDYLQLVNGAEPRQSLAIHYENVAQACAEASVQYGIWVVAAAQLNNDGGIRHSEGLLLACDMAHALHPIEEKYAHMELQAWMECLAARYTEGGNIGAEDYGKLVFDVKSGPHFRDAL